MPLLQCKPCVPLRDSRFALLAVHIALLHSFLNCSLYYSLPIIHTHKGHDCILSMLTGHISGHKIGDSNLGPRVWYLMSDAIHVHIQTSLRVQVRVGAGLTVSPLYLVSMINWSVPCCAVVCYVVCVNYVLWAPTLRCPFVTC